MELYEEHDPIPLRNSKCVNARALTRSFSLTVPFYVMLLAPAQLFLSSFVVLLLFSFSPCAAITSSPLLFVPRQEERLIYKDLTLCDQAVGLSIPNPLTASVLVVQLEVNVTTNSTGPVGQVRLSLIPQAPISSWTADTAPYAATAEVRNLV